MDVNRVASAYQTPAAPAVSESAPLPPQPVQQAAPQYEVRTPEGSEGVDTLRRAVASVNTSIASYSRHMSINFHEATGRRIVTVYDSETNQPVREIPPERVLDAHASILELAGLFMDHRG